MIILPNTGTATREKGGIVAPKTAMIPPKCPSRIGTDWQYAGKVTIEKAGEDVTIQCLGV